MTSTEQGAEFCQHLRNKGIGGRTAKPYLPNLPVQAACLIRKHYTRYRQTSRNGDLERISFYLAGYGTKNRQSYPAIVSLRR